VDEAGVGGASAVVADRLWDYLAVTQGQKGQNLLYVIFSLRNAVDLRVKCGRVVSSPSFKDISKKQLT
jgi:hypothetical protein